MTKMTPQARNDTEHRILRVLDYIHDNPAGDLSLDALADVAAMSRFHWHRVFRAITGETAAQTVRRMRLHRASVALVQGDLPVPRIAASVGYANPTSFARAFAEHYGMTPLVFRQRGLLRPENVTRTTGDQTMPTYPEHPVDIREIEQRRLIALLHAGAYPQVGRAFEKLAGIMGARGLFAHAGRSVAVFYDDPSAVAEPDLRSHAGFEYTGDAPLEPPLEEVLLPGGRHAVLTFRGSYAGLTAAYDYLYCDWLPASGENPADRPAYELYLNSPMDTAPDDLVTEIMLPLA